MWAALWVRQRQSFDQPDFADLARTSLTILYRDRNRRSDRRRTRAGFAPRRARGARPGAGRARQAAWTAEGGRRTARGGGSRGRRIDGESAGRSRTICGPCSAAYASLRSPTMPTRRRGSRLIWPTPAAVGRRCCATKTSARRRSPRSVSRRASTPTRSARPFAGRNGRTALEKRAPSRRSSGRIGSGSARCPGADGRGHCGPAARAGRRAAARRTRRTLRLRRPANRGPGGPRGRDGVACGTARPGGGGAGRGERPHRRARGHADQRRISAGRA